MDRWSFVGIVGIRRNQTSRRLDILTVFATTRFQTAKRRTAAHVGRDEAGESGRQESRYCPYRVGNAEQHACMPATTQQHSRYDETTRLCASYLGSQHDASQSADAGGSGSLLVDICRPRPAAKSRQISLRSVNSDRSSRQTDLLWSY